MDRLTTLKFLRNFGSTISNAQMGYGKCEWERLSSLDSKFLICLERYLAEYCLESLKEFTLNGIEPDRAAAFEATGVQFRNVEKVFTNRCYFADNFSFEANFPNVQSLKLLDARCTFNIKDWHFPTVKNLYFDCCRCESDPKVLRKFSYQFSEIDLIEMFKRQPQLEKLHLLITFDPFPPNFSECFNEFLPKLQSLNLEFILDFIPPNFEPLHLEHVTDFTLKLRNLRKHQPFPFTFNRLERLKINLHYVYLTHSDSAAIISEFIFKNKHLKAINLEGIRGDFQQLFQFEHILSNVEELRICGFQNVSSDIIESFLTQSKSLKLLKICGIDGITDALESKISEKIPHVRWRLDADKDMEFIFRL